MKLLHIGKYFPPYRGGMETYLSDLVEAQIKQGHEVTVLVHNHDWGIVRSKTKIEQPQPSLTLIRQACLRPILFTPLMLGLNRRVKKLRQSNGFDVVHLHAPNPSLFFLLLGRRTKQKPWLIRWHADMVTESSSFLLKIIYRLIKPFETALLNRVDKIFISSAAYIEKSEVLQRFREKVVVIPLGLQTNDFLSKSHSPQAPKAPDDVFKIFTLGRLTYYKNHQQLISAMTDLPTMQLTIGGGGDLAGSLQAQIDTLGLNKKVKLSGSLSEAEKEQCFSQCHVFCLASNDRAESYGMVLLEAMLRNKIILVADTPGSGMKWLAENYNKGFVFAVNKTDDLVVKLNYIHNNYNEIQKRSDSFSLTIEQTAAALAPYYQNFNPE